jgi:DNA mismatch endonuclease (patch repair protein)
MDVFTPAQRSAVMRRVHSENTAPEMAVRRLVHGLGYRYRLHDHSLPGRPDLVLPRLRAAIFVHGCFWHQHTCEAAARPASRSEYWNAKLDRNAARDRKNLRLLRMSGWATLVVWECQTRRLERLEKRLRAFLESR